MYIRMMGARRPHARPPRSRSSTRTTSPAAGAALPVLYRARSGLRRARVHPRLRGRSRQRGRRGRGHRQAADGLRLPRADDVVPGRRHADDRADRERVEGRAGPLLRRDDRDPRGDPEHRGRARRPRGQLAQARAAHRAGGRRATRGTARTRASRPPTRPPWLRRHKFWPPVAPRRQRLRRPQPVCTCPPIDSYGENSTE